MEISCSLRFTGNETWLKKLSNLFSSKNLNQPAADEPKCCVKIEVVECEPAIKKAKIDLATVDSGYRG